MKFPRARWFAVPVVLFGLVVAAAVMVWQPPGEDYPERIWLPAKTLRDADGGILFHRERGSPADPGLSGVVDGNGMAVLARFPDLSPGPLFRLRLLWAGRNPPTPTWYSVVGDVADDARWVEFRRRDDI